MVHQYQLNGYNIVLDTCSGSVHVVDEVAYDIIALYPDHSADEIVSAMMAKYGSREDVTEEDLRAVHRRCGCFERGRQAVEPGRLREHGRSISKIGTPWSRRSASTWPTPATSTAPTASPRQGKYQGDRALMSFEVGKRAMDFLIENTPAPAATWRWISSAASR